MKKILEQIFLENEFELVRKSEEFTFFGKENREYFFTASYEAEELENFFTCDKTDNIINIQSEFNKKNEDVNKNTSLVIYVKTNNFEEFFEKNKGILYRIEEDEYYFRKYIIVYTENSIKELRISRDIGMKLREILLDSGRMDKFEEIYYEDEEFHLVMQIYIKLSFLIYEMEDKRFEPITQEIMKKLDNEDLSYQYQLIKTWLNREETSSSNEDQEDVDKEKQYFESLRASFLNTEQDEENLIEFFNRLEE